MSKVLIYGGCVTRDVFTKEFDEENHFELLQYFARYSLAKVPFDKVDRVPDISLSSKFQKRVLLQEMNNELRTALVNLSYNFIIFDFLTIRLPIISYRNTFLTESLELNNSGGLKNNIPFKRLSPRDELFWYFWEKGLLCVLDTLKNINKLDRLYIQELYWATHDNGGNLLSNQNNIFIQNKYLDRAYKIAKSHLDEDHFIVYNKDLFVSDVNHKWGLSPIHYIKEFYRESFFQFRELENNI